MSELPRDLASAPGPGVLPEAPDTTVAYTDFRRDESRDGVAPWARGVSVTAARLDGYGRVELVELDGRDTTGGRPFLAAVEAWERVSDHDHVAPVVGAGKRPRPWVATVGDSTLADRGRTELAHALWVGVCLAGALGYAHDEGAVHGAVTPGRVRLHPTPGWAFPRLDGFGLARLLHEGNDATIRDPPERLALRGRLGRATDVYGLALTLYEALTGDLPYVTDADPREAVLGAAPTPRTRSSRRFRRPSTTCCSPRWRRTRPTGPTSTRSATTSSRCWRPRPARATRRGPRTRRSTRRSPSSTATGRTGGRPVPPADGR